MFKRDCDIFTFFTLLFHIIKGGRMFKRLFEYKPPYAWGGGAQLKKQTTTKSNIYMDNTLIRLIILSKNFFGLGWLHYANRHILHQDSSIFTQFYATEKSHSFPELRLLVNTINCVSPFGSKI